MTPFLDEVPWWPPIPSRDLWLLAPAIHALGSEIPECASNYHIRWEVLKCVNSRKIHGRSGPICEQLRNYTRIFVGDYPGDRPGSCRMFRREGGSTVKKW